MAIVATAGLVSLENALHADLHDGFQGCLFPGLTSLRLGPGALNPLWGATYQLRTIAPLSGLRCLTLGGMVRLAFEPPGGGRYLLAQLSHLTALKVPWMLTAAVVPPMPALLNVSVSVLLPGGLAALARQAPGLTRLCVREFVSLQQSDLQAVLPGLRVLQLGGLHLIPGLHRSGLQSGRVALALQCLLSSVVYLTHNPNDRATVSFAACGPCLAQGLTALTSLELPSSRWEGYPAAVLPGTADWQAVAALPALRSLDCACPQLPGGAGDQGGAAAAGGAGARPTSRLA